MKSNGNYDCSKCTHNVDYICEEYHVDTRRLIMLICNKYDCNHPGEPVLGYMTMKGILRRTMRCPDCGELLDYMPQYNED